MSPADIRDLVQRRLFTPFRVITSDGTIYEVRVRLEPEQEAIAEA